MRYSRLITAVTVALLASGSAVKAIQDSSGEPACRRVSLPAHRISTNSATYVPALRRILLVDPVMNRLLLVGEDGVVTTLADPQVAASAKLPALVSPTPDGFVLKLVDSEIVTFDRQMRLRSGPKPLTAGGKSDPAVGSISQWTVAGDAIIAYGSLRSPSFPSGYELGFLRAPLTGGGRPEMLLPFQSNSYYQLGYQYLASIGRVAYFLRMGDEAVLYAVPPGSIEPVPQPGAVPPAFRSVPRLRTPFNGPADGPAHYAELEHLAIPAGLYGGPDGFLYLLTRKPGKAAGETDWWLYRLSPEDGKVLGHAQLPTKAKHLTVVPSPAAWFFVEKGEVDSLARQPIESLIVVPSSHLTRMTAAGWELCPEVRP